MATAFQSNAFQNNAFQIDGGGGSPPPPPARHGGFYEEWRGHTPKRSREEEARDTYQAVREAFEGVKKVAPKKAAEIAPPALKAAEPPPVDWQALDALQRAVEAFAERQSKQAVRRAAEEYRARLAAYKAAVEAQLAQEALAAFEAEQARIREAAIAADDEEVIALYLQWRRSIAMQAIAIVQARQERLSGNTPV